MDIKLFIFFIIKKQVVKFITELTLGLTGRTRKF